MLASIGAANRAQLTGGTQTHDPCRFYHAILAFRGYRALAMIRQSAGLYVFYLPVPARFGRFNFNSSACTASSAFSSGSMACNSDRVTSIMLLIFVVLCEFIIHPTEQLCDKIYGSYKRSTKHEVRGSTPLNPPASGGRFIC